MTVTLTSTNVVCFSECNGTITANVNGGTAPYTYLWNDSAFNTTATATNLCAGTYSVTVTDALGLNYQAYASINQPMLLNVSLSNQNPTTTGGSDGYIIASVTGGIPPYTYIWSNVQTGATAINLGAGIYTLTVTDANGCSVNSSAQLFDPNVTTCQAGFVYSTSPADPYTFAFWDSSFTNSNIMFYAWSFEGQILTQPQITVTFNSPGVHYMCHTITTIDSCTSTFCDSIYINPGSSTCQAYFNFYLDSLTVPPVSPYVFVDLSVSDSASIITSYLWNFGDGSFDTVANPVHIFQNGNFAVCLTITTSNGCSSTFCDSIYINTNPQNYCNGLTTFIAPQGTFSDGSGSANYQNNVDCMWLIQPAIMPPAAFSIQLGFTSFNTENINDKVRIYDGANTSSPLLAEFSGNITSIPLVISSGEAMLVEFISDASGNNTGWDAYYNIVFDSIPDTLCNLSASYIVTPVSVIGGIDGVIDVTVTGGTAPYSYIWSNGSSTQDLNGVSAGIYSVSITDATQNCPLVILYASLYEPYDPAGGSIVDSLYTTIVDTCFIFPIDSFYIAQMVVNNNNTITVTWVFTGTGNPYSITVEYSYSEIGNQIIFLTVNCNGSKTLTTYMSYIHINTINSISEIHSKNDLFAYPVPVSDILNIKMNMDKQTYVILSVQNLEGQIVYQKNAKSNVGENIWKVDMESLSKGFYILGITVDGNLKAVRKITK